MRKIYNLLAVVALVMLSANAFAQLAIDIPEDMGNVWPWIELDALQTGDVVHVEGAYTTTQIGVNNGTEYDVQWVSVRFMQLANADWSEIRIEENYVYSLADEIGTNDGVINIDVTLPADWVLTADNADTDHMLLQVRAHYSDDKYDLDGTETAEVDDYVNAWMYDITAGDPEAVKEVQHNALNVYPNPATQGASVILSADDIEGTVNVSVISLTGKEVYKASTVAGKIAVSTSELSRGLYFVRVESADKVYTQKLIVE